MILRNCLNKTYARKTFVAENAWKYYKLSKMDTYNKVIFHYVGTSMFGKISPNESLKAAWKMWKPHVFLFLNCRAGTWHMKVYTTRVK